MKGQTDTGRLRIPVTIEQSAATVNDMGNEKYTWTTFASLNAAVMPLQAKDRFEQMVVQNRIEVRLRARYYPGITTAMRATVKGKTYRIHSVTNHDERDRWMEILLSRYEGES